jgi:enamine deaminase RidA (YjgF/YER057c/UK114 family)
VAHLDYPLFIVNKSKINLNMKQILPLCIVLLLFALHTQAQTPEEKLKALNIELPAVKAPIANYVHVVRTGNLLYLSGKGPSDANGNSITGKVGRELTIEQGQKAARSVAITQIAVLKNELGDLSRVKRIVKVLGMVQCEDTFTEQPKVMNGFSDLMVEVFGEKGKHARSAVGMSALPGNIAVEVELIVEVEPDGIASQQTIPITDLLRIAELDQNYWGEISRTVKEGDFEGYKATCHDNAVLVATAGKNKRSEPMTVALGRWKQGFIDTKQGKQMDQVSFRFSQRIGSETTAHETGIFHFSSHDTTGKVLSDVYVHFEELLVKQGDRWLCMMEFQKSNATKAEWDALK